MNSANYSTLIRTHSHQKTANYTHLQVNPHLPSPRVPAEILDRIIELALSGSGLYNDFDNIANFTLASTSFRQIALRRYFHDVTVHSEVQWVGILLLLRTQEEGGVGRLGGGGFQWIKSLCTSSAILLRSQHIGIARLTHLRALSVNFAREGLSTQHPRLVLLCRPFILAPASALHLSSLTLTSLPRIDTAVLHLIAMAFPGLIDLYLSSTERLFYYCCYTCLVDSLGCTIHSPIPDMFCQVEDLAIAFAEALKPLKHLTYLHLGIFLSDEQLIYSHIDHSLEDYEPHEIVCGPDECDLCAEIAPIKMVRMRELAASFIIAQTLKSIRCIGWSSLFTKDTGNTENDGDKGEDESDDQAEEEELDGIERKTKVWVFREFGRIKVRRIS